VIAVTGSARARAAGPWAYYVFISGIRETMHVPSQCVASEQEQLRTTVEMRVAHCMAVNISVRVRGPGAYDQDSYYILSSDFLLSSRSEPGTYSSENIYQPRLLYPRDPELSGAQTFQPDSDQL
jgi:hypothetical protein